MLNALMIVTIPSTPQRFYVTFSTQANSDIRLGECLETFREINLLLRQEHSLIFPPNLWVGYLSEDWAHLCELWCVQSLLQHLLLDASFRIMWLNEVKVNFVFVFSEFVFFHFGNFRKWLERDMKTPNIRKTPRKWTFQKETCFQLNFY